MPPELGSIPRELTECLPSPRLQVTEVAKAAAFALEVVKEHEKALASLAARYGLYPGLRALGFVVEGGESLQHLQDLHHLTRLVMEGDGGLEDVEGSILPFNHKPKACADAFALELVTEHERALASLAARYGLYKGTSLIINCPTLAPYNSFMSRALWCYQGAMALW